PRTVRCILSPSGYLICCGPWVLRRGASGSGPRKRVGWISTFRPITTRASCQIWARCRWPRRPRRSRFWPACSAAGRIPPARKSCDSSQRKKKSPRRRSKLHRAINSGRLIQAGVARGLAQREGFLHLDATLVLDEEAQQRDHAGKDGGQPLAGLPARLSAQIQAGDAVKHEENAVGRADIGEPGRGVIAAQDQVLEDHLHDQNEQPDTGGDRHDRVPLQGLSDPLLACRVDLGARWLGRGWLRHLLFSLYGWGGLSGIERAGANPRRTGAFCGLPGRVAAPSGPPA